MRNANLHGSAPKYGLTAAANGWIVRLRTSCAVWQIVLGDVAHGSVSGVLVPEPECWLTEPPTVNPVLVDVRA